MIKQMYRVDMRKYIAILHSTKIDEYHVYLKDLYKKKRMAATHALVVMVSDEERKRKPYAISVQYVPYQSITDQQARWIAHEVKLKMIEEDLTVISKFDNVLYHLRKSAMWIK